MKTCTKLCSVYVHGQLYSHTESWHHCLDPSPNNYDHFTLLI